MREGLYAIVGAAGVGEDTESYRIGNALPAAVVLPENEAEVCALLEYAQGMRAPCIAAGSGTHLTHLTPHERAWWLLSTRRLNRIVDYSPQDLVLTVGAGMTLQAVQDLLRQHNQYLPWNPALPAQATIGGIVASNRAGSWRYRYGTPRDRVLAVRAVRPDGVAFKSGAKVVKSVAGYDLHRLLCGSWGTLAVITEVTLKVQPLPQQFEAVGWFASWETLEPTLAELMRMPIQPDGMTVVALRARESQGWSGLREVAMSTLEWGRVQRENPDFARNESIGWAEIPRFARNNMACSPRPDMSFRAKRGISFQSELLSSNPNRGALALFCPHPQPLSHGVGEGSRFLFSTSPPNPLSVNGEVEPCGCMASVPLSPFTERGDRGVRLKQHLHRQPSATITETPRLGRVEPLTSQTLPKPETQLQPLTMSETPQPYILLEFSGRSEGVAWQIQHLREQGYPAEPVDETLLYQIRDWLAPRPHALMLQILLRSSEVADEMVRWTELPGVSAIAHAGSGVLYIAADESGLTETLIQRIRVLNAKYRVLNGAAWLREQTSGELPRMTLSEGERRLMQHLKHALDARNILPALV